MGGGSRAHACGCVGVCVCMWQAFITQLSQLELHSGSLKVCFKLCRHQLRLLSQALAVCACVCVRACRCGGGCVALALATCALIASNSYEILIANVEITQPVRKPQTEDKKKKCNGKRTVEGAGRVGR